MRALCPCEAKCSLTIAAQRLRIAVTSIRPGSRPRLVRSASFHSIEVFVAQAGLGHYARRRQQVGVVIARVAFAVRAVDRDVDRAAVAVGQVLRERPHQVAPLRGIQLVWQRDLVLPRHPRVLALLGRLCGVPQPLAIVRPADVALC